ncbi:MAG: YraN family protein [Rhizobiales bacterium]|nr:YraN family protein [Hyphomicrobiales bacterium]
MTRARRLVARGFGLRAETLAAWRLRLAGYRILARGYLARGGEIDIVAAKGDALVFVEVKARPSLDEALTAVTPQKRERLSRAARQWLVEHPAFASRTLRGDLVAVAPGRWPRHCVAAVPLDLGHL